MSNWHNAIQWRRLSDFNSVAYQSWCIMEDSYRYKVLQKNPFKEEIWWHARSVCLRGCKIFTSIEYVIEECEEKLLLGYHIQNWSSWDDQWSLTTAVACTEMRLKSIRQWRRESRADRWQKGYLGIDNITQSSVLKNLYKRYLDIIVQFEISESHAKDEPWFRASSPAP